jgi:hypothetical protein
MRILRFVCAALVAAIAHPALAAKVNTDFDATADFSQYRTYVWGEGNPARNPLIAQRIVEGIEARLAAKGLQKASTEAEADLIVVYQTATDTKTQINTYSTGHWGGWRWGMGTTQATVREIPVGQLIVDMADVKAQRFVWRGTASGTVSDNPDKMTKTLNKALDKMFDNYPPKVKE